MSISTSDHAPRAAVPGDPDRYPARDEVTDYLEHQAAALPGRDSGQHAGGDGASGRPRVRRGDGRGVGIARRWSRRGQRVVLERLPTRLVGPGAAVGITELESAPLT